jgi:hypothetical protein
VSTVIGTAVRDAIQTREVRAITLTFTFSSSCGGIDCASCCLLQKFPIRAVVYIIRQGNLRFAVGQSKRSSHSPYGLSNKLWCAQAVLHVISTNWQALRAQTATAVTPDSIDNETIRYYNPPKTGGRAPLNVTCVELLFIMRNTTEPDTDSSWACVDFINENK